MANRDRHQELGGDDSTHSRDVTSLPPDPYRMGNIVIQTPVSPTWTESGGMDKTALHRLRRGIDFEVDPDAGPPPPSDGGMSNPVEQEK